MICSVKELPGCVVDRFRVVPVGDGQVGAFDPVGFQARVGDPVNVGVRTGAARGCPATPAKQRLSPTLRFAVCSTVLWGAYISPESGIGEFRVRVRQPQRPGRVDGVDRVGVVGGAVHPFRGAVGGDEEPPLEETAVAGARLARITVPVEAFSSGRRERRRRHLRGHRSSVASPSPGTATPV